MKIKHTKNIGENYSVQHQEGKGHTLKLADFVNGIDPFMERSVLFNRGMDDVFGATAIVGHGPHRYEVYRSRTI